MLGSTSTGAAAAKREPESDREGAGREGGDKGHKKPAPGESEYGAEEAMESMPRAVDSAEKEQVHKRRLKSKGAKKPKDMPRRPMSAYNAFFQEQRMLMLEEARRRQVTGQGHPPGRPKIGFEDMAKTIGKRWRELRPEDMGPYQKRAQVTIVSFSVVFSVGVASY